MLDDYVLYAPGTFGKMVVGRPLERGLGARGVHFESNVNAILSMMPAVFVY